MKKREREKSYILRPCEPGAGRSLARALAMTVVLLSLGIPSVCAQTGADYAVGISQKFGRGLLNVLSSPLEIPCAIRDEIEERGAGGAVTGFFRGLVFMARRLLVGSAEVGTFMIPMEATLPPVCAKKAEARVT